MSAAYSFQQQCDPTQAVNAIGAPETWATLAPWEPWKYYTSYDDWAAAVQAGLACWPYDSSQRQLIQTGLQRVKQCWPCKDVHGVTTTGPRCIEGQYCPPWIQTMSAGQPLAPPPVSVPPGPDASTGFWHTYQATGAPPPVTGPVAPPTSITGVQNPVVVQNPDGSTVTVVPPPASAGASGGFPPSGGVTGPQGASGAAPSTTSAASAPGPVTAIINSVFGHPIWLALAVGAIWFLFFRGKR